MGLPADHASLLAAAQRDLAEAQLALVRAGTLDGTHATPALDRLFAPEGQEQLEQAIRDHRYERAELAHVAPQLADLAEGRVRLAAQRWLSGWLTSRVAIGSEARSPATLLSWIAQPVLGPHGPGDVLAALARALEPHVGYCIELSERIDHARDTQLLAANSRIQSAARREEVSSLEPTTAPEAQPTETAVDRARAWLEATDDAAHELTRWLLKRQLGHAHGALPELLTALRAQPLDGLARPQRRFHRLAEGARRLGFERDMNQRMRGEHGEWPLLPWSACIAFNAPHDVRVVQPALEYGLLSDFATAQGIGEALALVLVSPALGPARSRPLGVSVSTAFGGLFLQLRADPGYLRRIDGLERDVAGSTARHGALWTLLRVRLAAALVVARVAPVRSSQERVAQLMAAGERALGWELPRGIAALTLLSDPVRDFEAIARGCELHAALRERYDVDFYLNPRIQDVLRGAAARGNELDAAGLAAELGTGTSVGHRRLLELLA